MAKGVRCDMVRVGRAAEGSSALAAAPKTCARRAARATDMALVEQRQRHPERAGSSTQRHGMSSASTLRGTNSVDQGIGPSPREALSFGNGDTVEPQALVQSRRCSTAAGSANVEGARAGLRACVDFETLATRLAEPRSELEQA